MKLNAVLAVKSDLNVLKNSLLLVGELTSDEKEVFNFIDEMLESEIYFLKETNNE